jgi:hypothetical protein
MSEQDGRMTRLAIAMLCALTAVVFCDGAVAKGRSTIPVGRCLGVPSGYCVKFAPGEHPGEYDLRYAGGKSKHGMHQGDGIRNFAVSSSSVWNTTAPVELTRLFEPATSCKRVDSFEDMSKSPMNLTGSHLYINTDNSQHMYLVYDNQILERSLDPQIGPYRPGSNETAVLWLQAQQDTKDEKDINPFDYFIEFRSTADDLKLYRVEAFHHLDSPDQAQTACDCERPDVQHAQTPVNACLEHERKLSSGSVFMFQPSTGEGNEPGHD